jgi:hypothetical protein
MSMTLVRKLAGLDSRRVGRLGQLAEIEVVLLQRSCLSGTGQRARNMLFFARGALRFRLEVISADMKTAIQRSEHLFPFILLKYHPNHVSSDNICETKFKYWSCDCITEQLVLMHHPPPLTGCFRHYRLIESNNYCQRDGFYEARTGTVPRCVGYIFSTDIGCMEPLIIYSNALLRIQDAKMNDNIIMMSRKILEYEYLYAVLVIFCT